MGKGTGGFFLGGRVFLPSLLLLSLLLLLLLILRPALLAKRTIRDFQARQSADPNVADEQQKNDDQQSHEYTCCKT